MFNKLFIFIDALYEIKTLPAFRAVLILLMAFCFVTGYFVVDAAVELWDKYDKSEIING
jgi:hypothetical protein